MTVRVDSYAVVCDYDVHALAGSGHGRDFRADRGDTALQKRADDDGALSALGGIRMSALRAGDDTVGAYHYVAVEVNVNLKGCQNDIIKFVDERALVEGVRVCTCSDAVVSGVDDVVDCVKVESLRIHQDADHAHIQKVAHGFGQSAYAKSHLDVALFHDAGQGDGRSDGSSADAGLIGETILEVRSVHNDLRAVFSHHQLALIGSGFRCACSDLLGDTDGIHNDNTVNLGHGDVCREVRERYQAVSDRYYILSTVAVDVGVTQNAAVGLAADTAEVAVIIGCGSADECDVNLCLTRYQRADTSAVAAHDRKALEFAVGDRFADLAADTGGLDAGDGAVFDHGNKSFVSLAQGSGCQCDVLKTHVVDLLHDHVDDQVAFTEMMVEADGHAAVRFAFDQGFTDILAHLTVLIVHYRTDNGSLSSERHAIFIIIALKGLFPRCSEDFIGNFPTDCISHITNLLTLLVAW